MTREGKGYGKDSKLSGALSYFWSPDQIKCLEMMGHWNFELSVVQWLPFLVVTKSRI